MCARMGGGTEGEGGGAGRVRKNERDLSGFCFWVGGEERRQNSLQPRPGQTFQLPFLILSRRGFFCSR